MVASSIATMIFQEALQLGWILFLIGSWPQSPPPRSSVSLCVLVRVFFTQYIIPFSIGWEVHTILRNHTPAPMQLAEYILSGLKTGLCCNRDVNDSGIKVGVFTEMEETVQCTVKATETGTASDQGITWASDEQSANLSHCITHACPTALSLFC